MKGKNQSTKSASEVLSSITKKTPNNTYDANNFFIVWNFKQLEIREMLKYGIKTSLKWKLDVFQFGSKRFDFGFLLECLKKYFAILSIL